VGVTSGSMKLGLFFPCLKITSSTGSISFSHIARQL